MNFLSAIIIGIVQGILEWLPISSQGNISLLMVGAWGLTLEEALKYSIWVHLGTLFSVLAYFRKDIKELLKREVSLKPFGIGKTLLFLFVATAISGIVGAPLYLLMKNFPIQQGKIAVAAIGGFLVLTGAMQLAARERKKEAQPSIKSAAITGIAQGFSAIPGISRSGTTTSILLMQGFSSEQALRLSFLLSIPLVLGAEVFLGLFETSVITYYSLASCLAAFIVGIVTIDLFLKIARKVKFGWFCIGLGIASMIPLFFL